MFFDQFGGVWLTNPLVLLGFGVAVFAVIGVAHQGVAADAGATSESRLARRLAVLDELSAAFGAAVATLDASEQTRTRRRTKAAVSTPAAVYPTQGTPRASQVERRVRRGRRPVRTRGWDDSRVEEAAAGPLRPTASERARAA